MIAGGFGSCSTLVHLIAQYPKVTLMIGVVGTAVYLSGAAGPGYHTGNEKSIQVLSERNESSVEDAKIRGRFDAIWRDDSETSDHVVKEMIRKCGCDMTLDTVKSDKGLLRDVTFLYFLDLAHTDGITQAEARLTSELAVQEGTSTGGRNKR